MLRKQAIRSWRNTSHERIMTVVSLQILEPWWFDTWLS